MPLKRVRLYYGVGYGSWLDLNDGIGFVSSTYGLFDTAEVDALQGEPVYERPFETRGKLKDRVFSITAEILAPNYNATYNAALNAMKVAANSDFDKTVRVEVERLLPSAPPLPPSRTVYMYVTARCEKIVQDRPGVYTLTFKAADPIFSSSAGVTQRSSASLGGSSVSTALSSNNYPDISMPYEGTYPAEPKITFTAQQPGGVWRYYRDVYITNRSPLTLSYHPICLFLGDIHTDVYPSGGRKYHTDVTGNVIQDIRIEALGGGRRLCWVRDRNPSTGLPDHTSVKVWTILYSLRPGETVVLRVLYGNPNCVVEDTSSYDNIRPMFNMYTSDNTRWDYGDFLPLWPNQQSRAFQWQPYSPQRYNLDWIRTTHTHFDPGAGNVPCGGGKVDFHGVTSGAAGVQLNVPVPMARLTGGYRLSTNNKDPFVIRRKTFDSRIDDIWQYPPAASPPNLAANKALLTTTSAPSASGSSVVHLTTITGGGSTLATGDTLVVVLDTGYILRSLTTGALPIVTGISGPDVTIGVPLTSPVSAGNLVQQQGTGSVDISWVGADEPIALGFLLRSDVTTQDSGYWYYGGMEYCSIYFDSTMFPSTGNAPNTNSSWTSCPETDLYTGTSYQIRGMFGNELLGEHIRISTIMYQLGDRVVVDCNERTCYYYKLFYTVLSATGVAGSVVITLADATSFSVGMRVWVALDNGGTYRSTVVAKTGNVLQMKDPLSGAASGGRPVGVWESRYDALDTGSPRRYWVHIDPNQPMQALHFIPDPDSNFANLRVDVEYAQLYL